MPIGINHGTAQRIVLSLEQFMGATCQYIRSSMVTTHMKHHILRIRAVGGMTVYAHTRHLSIFKNGSLFKIGKIALIYAHVPINLISRSNKPVSHSPFIQSILAYIYAEVFILS